MIHRTGLRDNTCHIIDFSVNLQAFDNLFFFLIVGPTFFMADIMVSPNTCG